MSDNKELISVVIPIYNGESYIMGMLEMLKKQTYQNLEIILVNDGSTDATLDILKKEIGEDSRFFILDKENTGPSDSRNRGLDCCHGEYVGFIDSDDYIFPEYFQYLYELLKKYNADISCCNYRKVKEKQGIPVYELKENEYVFSNVEALCNMYRKEKITGYPYLKLFKRSILEKVRFPSDITYAEDIVFVDGAIKKSKKVVYGDRILYIYFQNQKSITHSVNPEALKKAWQYNLDHFEKDEEEKYPQLRIAVCCKQFIMAMDLASRVSKIDKEFYRELLRYIRKTAFIVSEDPNNTKLQRTLGKFARISARGTVKLCVLFNFMKEKMGFQMQKAV